MCEISALLQKQEYEKKLTQDSEIKPHTFHVSFFYQMIITLEDHQIIIYSMKNYCRLLANTIFRSSNKTM